jgi:transcriptional regulator with XRE-family HTH domain
MAKYHNTRDTKKLGSRIKELRLANEFSIEDIASMTGFARQTINAIEKGSNTDSSHLIEIAKAIGVHPMELFNFTLELKPRYKLSPKRINSNLLTLRLNKLYSETDFFKTPKFVSDVVAYLSGELNVKSSSTKVSVVLKRLVADGKLQHSKNGRRNSYLKKKK